ncbi:MULTISPECIES: ABC transporter ATP-binding protein [Microbacterium]|uniref:ABC transporter ATP-binding protein n=1 Tax=Microbacterium wangchenii TaxID=2541726 RepID=A0ABX5SRZ6_9MICO|nr:MULTISPECIES: ABC transporter ATP-binding protein [Microbacterium]MCK6066722.1 ABC transporter ATP-binding protein [Microbacterium sp. EYE_512]QBR88047.1 ABC transporter ATP-binding protein [Microbacterium wangchenii]TFV83836.1 ABC transporter ATP-binding protein [Microbacterium sp. dk485]TXK18163.1 ABC transporter ATP-binding protein [Microbacterium wangchenii]
MKLELRGITKRFGPLVANDAVDLTVESGQIHALLGENGAGKSTLMNVLFGLYQPDEGEILLDDVPQHFSGPGQAMAAGIGMVHQHFMLIPVFTVAENVILGHEPSRGGVLDLPAARALVREISDRFGFDIDPDAVVGDLPVGAQQRVEIIKALARDARVLVLDEPTAVLTPQETDELMATMRRLADGGTSIVFITHKLREVRAVADTITVIRLGRVVGEAAPTATNDELAALMVGRAVELTVHKDPPRLGAEALVVENLTVFGPAGERLLDDVSFTIRAGEVLAVAGVQGNGQTELTEALVGLRDRVQGSIRLDGQELSSAHVRHVLDSGVGFVPEDRKVDGLVAEFTVAENLMLDRSFAGPFTKGPAIDFAHRDRFADEAIAEFDIRTPHRDVLVGRLSGGNQQKVVLARELGRDLKLFVASQPTRGVDVGSIEFIHERIVQIRDSGIPVLIISTELDEVVALADRIAVMYRGAIIDIVPADAPRERLGRLMAGVHE